MPTLLPPRNDPAGFNLFVTLGVIATVGAYFIAGLLHNHFLGILTSWLQYTLSIPIWTNIFSIFSITNLHDVSWGTKEGNVQTLTAAMHERKAKKAGERAVVAAARAEELEMMSPDDAAAMFGRNGQGDYENGQQNGQPRPDEVSRLRRASTRLQVMDAGSGAAYDVGGMRQPRNSLVGISPSGAYAGATNNAATQLPFLNIVGVVGGLPTAGEEVMDPETPRNYRVHPATSGGGRSDRTQWDTQNARITEPQQQQRVDSASVVESMVAGATDPNARRASMKFIGAGGAAARSYVVAYADGARDVGLDLPLEETAAAAVALAYRDPRGIARELATRARKEQAAKLEEAAAEKRTAEAMAEDRRKLADDFQAFRLRVTLAFVFTQVAVVGVVLALSPDLKLYAQIITGMVIFQIGMKLIGSFVYVAERYGRMASRFFCIRAWYRIEKDMYGRTRLVCCWRPVDYYRFDDEHELENAYPHSYPGMGVEIADRVAAQVEASAQEEILPEEYHQQEVYSESYAETEIPTMSDEDVGDGSMGGIHRFVNNSTVTSYLDERTHRRQQRKDRRLSRQSRMSRQTASTQMLDQPPPSRAGYASDESTLAMEPAADDYLSPATASVVSGTMYGRGTVPRRTEAYTSQQADEYNRGGDPQPQQWRASNGERPLEHRASRTRLPTVLESDSRYNQQLPQQPDRNGYPSRRNSRVDVPGNFAQQQQYSPATQLPMQQQYSPAAQQHYSPAAQQHYSPAAQQQYSPAMQQPMQQQYSPAAQQQYSPAQQQQYVPAPSDGRRMSGTSLPGPAFGRRMSSSGVLPSGALRVQRGSNPSPGRGSMGTWT